MANHAPLWQWIGERERIRVRKEDEGRPPPWTDDPILRAYRFCNVRREDDRVTRWIRTNVRERFAGHPNLWLMLAIARVVNWPDTLAELVAAGAWPMDDDFEPRGMTRVLEARIARGAKLYTGAYVIPAPAERGGNKQAYVAETMCGSLWRRRESFRRAFEGRPTLQGVHALLTRSPGWGTFLAYQAAVDMRFTPLLDRAPDLESWAAAGPGTVRGLNRLHGRPVGAALSQEQALSEMRAIYRRAAAETGVRLDFSDVPNVLCEVDKYLRVARGEGRPRARYAVPRALASAEPPAQPGPSAPAVLPPPPESRGG